jgi:hypothetical protein
VKTTTCNKKYASEIKECVGKLSYSLGETMDHLIKHKERIHFKADQEFQRSNPKIRKVPDTSGTGTRSLTGIRLVIPPSGSTSSASTPKAGGETIQDFMKLSEEKIRPADMEVDVVTVDGTKLEEPHIVTRKTFVDQ